MKVKVNLTKAEINLIIEQMKQGEFDFNAFAPANFFATNVNALPTSGVAPTASAGISAPIFTG